MKRHKEKAEKQIIDNDKEKRKKQTAGNNALSLCLLFAIREAGRDQSIRVNTQIFTKSRRRNSI